MFQKVWSKTDKTKTTEEDPRKNMFQKVLVQNGQSQNNRVQQVLVQNGQNQTTMEDGKRKTKRLPSGRLLVLSWFYW